MVWLLVHSSPRYYYTAILFFTFDSIPRRRKFARAHEENVGDRFVEGIERTSHRTVCILITLPDIFNIPRMDVVNWIHLFPFLKIRLRAVLGFRIFLAVTLSLCTPFPSSCVIILRNFDPPLRYRVRSLSGSIRLRRYENRTRSRTRLLSSNICSYVPTVSSRETIWLSLIRRLPLLRSDGERSLFSFRWPNFFFLNAYFNYVRDYYKSFRYDRTDRNGFL